MKASLHKLRSHGDEIRYFVHLSHSDPALSALDRTYQITQRTGVLRGKKLSPAEKSKYATEMIAMMPKTIVSVEVVYKAMGGRLDRNQARWVLQYAASNGFGSFNELAGEFTWNEKQMVAVVRKLPKIAGNAPAGQIDLFDGL